MSVCHATPAPTARRSMPPWSSSSDTRQHAGDAVATQAELDVALDDLSSQASDFRAQGPEVHQAFWEVDAGRRP